eukprot:CAMPEP_0181089984 /NCGR_PEP_ID=MMETSP1071-20121207/7592_1 /TAXON_ID=35127 /ORGANISM="Thalassiosira sp., Strain NH16" /LENGTH=231 /DNA_ID=CAMNT_0023171965 /DNA_START=299 /DNA_END=994 /DNA_ORIENTATION=+
MPRFPITLEGGASQDDTSAQEKKAKYQAIVTKWDLPLVLFALAGGLLSSQIGSGADIACYLFGNFAISFGAQIAVGDGKYDDNAFTAMSVIVMASMSVLGAILRLTTQQDGAMAVSSKVLLVLFTCSPIVVLGAPVGSLFLTPSNQKRLRIAFYVLGVLQLLVFGVIKIGSDLRSWVAIAATICAVLGSLFLHYKMIASKGCGSIKTDISLKKKAVEEGSVLSYEEDTRRR